MNYKLIALSLVFLFSGLNVSAKDFALATLPHASSPMYDLDDQAGKISYYEFVRTIIGPKMQELADSDERGSNEAVLKAGGGVSVKLSDNNFNVHINFPNASLGGRSYGWTSGQVGDWSDAMYLDNLAKVTSSGDKQDLAAFYEVMINMLGACDANGIESLEYDTQRVAANFLAIYTAEAYRAMVPDAHPNWDDALAEVTLLGAFHGGQSELTKFYAGEFSAESKKQDSGVYANGSPGVNAADAEVKSAEMRDYWQFSGKPDSKRSGINLTRKDFEKMGQVITAYESTVARNRNLAKVQAIVGKDANVIKAITKFFATGKSQDVAVIQDLAKNVSKLMMNIYADADKITAWELNNEQ